jgi:hypothetical protein
MHPSIIGTLARIGSVIAIAWLLCAGTSSVWAQHSDAEWVPPADTPASLDGGASVNPALMEPVRDNTLGLEPHDRHAYFFMLWLCREIGADRLAQFAEAFRAERPALQPAPESSVFVDVFRHPDVYRGRPVTLEGRLRRLVKFAPGENDFGARHVYEGWVYTEGSQSNPAVVIFTKKPPELPMSGDLSENIRCTGYFFKLYGYDAQDATRSAPLFIAGEIEWSPQLATSAPTEAPPWLYAAATLLAVAVVWGLWCAHQRQNARRALPDCVG